MLKPDPAIAHQMTLDRHQSDQTLKKQGSKRTTTVRGGSGIYTPNDMQVEPITPRDTYVQKDVALGVPNKILVESEGQISPNRDLQNVGFDNQEND